MNGRAAQACTPSFCLTAPKTVGPAVPRTASDHWWPLSDLASALTQGCTARSDRRAARTGASVSAAHACLHSHCIFAMCVVGLRLCGWPLSLSSCPNAHQLFATAGSCCWPEGQGCMLLQTSVQWAAKHGTVRVLSKLLQACQALELDTAAGCGTLALRAAGT